MQPDLLHTYSMCPSTATGRVDATAEMMMERFEEVFAKSPEAVDEDTGHL